MPPDPEIERYGSESTLSMIDRNPFGPPFRISRHGIDTCKEVPLDDGFVDNTPVPGLGCTAALRCGRAVRPAPVARS